MPQDLYGRSACEKKKHDGASYVWLAYSIFFFIEPVMRRSLSYWLHQLPVYLLFLALYAGYVEFELPRVRLALLAGIFALGASTIPFNMGGSSFFIYVAAMLPFCVESSAVLWCVIALEVGTLAFESYFFPGNPINYLITGFFAVVVGVSNLFVAQGKRADRKLRLAQEENAALAAVAERERIARDLHDVLGHTLSVIVLKAELAGRLITTGAAKDRDRAATEIADVERTARTALGEVRETIGGFRSRGLMAELELARRALDAAGVELACESQPPLLGAKAETVLSLAVREAVTNIVRHAGASRCTLRFRSTGDGFDMLTVEDDGRGAGASEGNGLRGMRERVQALGGRFRVEWGAGTRVIVELPQDTIAGSRA